MASYCNLNHYVFNICIKARREPGHGMTGWWDGGMVGWWDGGMVGWWDRLHQYAYKYLCVPLVVSCARSHSGGRACVAMVASSSQVIMAILTYINLLPIPWRVAILVDALAKEHHQPGLDFYGRRAPSPHDARFTGQA